MEALESLKQDKLTIRSLTKEDMDALYYWKFLEPNQEAKKWNGPYIPEEHVSKEEFISNVMNGNSLLGVPSMLAIVFNGNFIGTLHAYWVDSNTRWMEVGIVIFDPSYWSGGYGTKAFRMWIDYIFNETSIHRLGISTWSGNIRMIKLAEKMGMKNEATIRKARTVNGEYYDAIKMGILREEWLQFTKGTLK